MSFGRRLKEARNRKGLTQVQAAREVEIDDTTLSKYENNRSEPDNSTLNKLATLYGVSVDWLHGRNKEDAVIYTEQDIRILHKINSLNEDTKELAIKILDKLKENS